MGLYLYFTIILVSAFVTFAAKPRVIISTDIGGDPDDFQSLAHYLVYADLFDTEGLISTPPGGPGRLAQIHQTLDAYKSDYPKLQTYGAYPSYDQLKSVSVQGAINAGAPSSSRSTNGSRLIVNAARKSDSRPLYVLVWGSITDLAQALHDAPDIKSKIRVYSIGSTNTTLDPASRDYVYNKHTDLWFIESDFTFRGMYEGGTQSGDLGNSSFVAQHVKGHGALGNFFNSKKTDIKMGDTPSVLYLISPLVGGVGNHDNPTSDSWGGKYKSTSHGSRYWTDISDNRVSDAGSVNRWRTQYLRHWQSRMDRCLQANGGTPPPPPPPPNPSTQSPFKGSPFAIPGTIQAEDFDNGGQGVAFSDVDASNNGGAYRSTGVDLESSNEAGYNVGWTKPGEWLEYTVNVASAGTHNLAARVASDRYGGAFRVEFGGSDKTGSLSVSNTGGTQKWTTLNKSVSLSVGQQVMRVYISGGDFNLNFITITKVLAKETAATSLLLSPSSQGDREFILPSGMQGVAIYDLSGKMIWTHRAKAPGASFNLPETVKNHNGILRLKYLD